MHYDAENDRYVLTPDVSNNWMISMAKEIKDLMDNLKPGENVRIDIRIGSNFQPAAMQHMKRVIQDYYGHRVTNTFGNSEIEVQVV